MKVYGLKLSLKADPITGEPPPLSELASRPGTIALWKRVDRSRQGLPEAHRQEITLSWDHVPDRTSPEFLAANPPLDVDPRQDVWTAPEWVDQLLLVTHVAEERPDQPKLLTRLPRPAELDSVASLPVVRRATALYAIRPRPEGWTPDVVVEIAGKAL